jgi:hypothetical protein
MALPTSPPNYNSPATDSAWWLQHEDPVSRSTDSSIVVATTGYAFVRYLQTFLSRHNFRNQKAYRGGGPLGGRAALGFGVGGANTDFTKPSADGKWGPSTNAALWRFVAENAVPSLTDSAPSDSTFTAGVLRYLDAIELSAKNRRIEPLALEAACWLVGSGGTGTGLNFTSQMAGNAKVVSVAPPDMVSRVVVPVWNTSAPQPTRAFALTAIRMWPAAASERPPAEPAVLDREIQPSAPRPNAGQTKFKLTPTTVIATGVLVAGVAVIASSIRSSRQS